MRGMNPHTFPKNALPAEKWNELHDYLTLALDALGDGPDDFDWNFLSNAVMHQRLALRITHNALRRIGGEA